jgi:hypothetical protein
MGTVNNATRQAAADAVANVFEAAGAILEIGVSGFGTTLVTFDLAVTQPVATNGVWTLDFDADTVAAGGTGTAAEARIRDSGTPTYEISGLTVSTSGADINFDSVSITSGQNVTLSSMTVTVPAATA